MAINKRPLLPVITIKKDDATLYTWNPFAGTFDFRVQSLRFTPVADSKGGQFQLTIVSSDATNVNARTLLTNITGNNEVTIWVGKTDTTKTKVFLGIVETVETYEPNLNLTTITLSGPDFGSNILKRRILDRSWTRAKESDGITLANDVTVLISQIVSDIITGAESLYVETDPTIES